MRASLRIGSSHVQNVALIAQKEIRRADETSHCHTCFFLSVSRLNWLAYTSLDLPGFYVARCMQRRTYFSVSLSGLRWPYQRFVALIFGISRLIEVHLGLCEPTWKYQRLFTIAWADPGTSTLVWAYRRLSELVTLWAYWHEFAFLRP